MPLWLPVRAVPLLLPLEGRLALALPVRPLVPAVGLLLLADWLPAVGRPELLPEFTRPVEALPEVVGRVPLIDPLALGRPATLAPLCGAKPLLVEGRLIEPEVPLLPRRTLAT